MIKKGLPLLMLFLLLWGRRVSAGTDGVRRVYIFEEARLENINHGQSFFLFFSGELARCQGDAFLFFSDVRLTGHQGTVYAFFSTVEHGAPGLFSFSSKILHGLGPAPQPLLPFLAPFARQTPGVYEDTLPPFLFSLFCSLVSVTLLFLAVPMRKSFFEQGAMALGREPRATLRLGLVAYGAAVSLCAVFMYSVVGFPVALLLLAALAGVALGGQAALAIGLGFFLLRRRGARAGKPANTYANLLLGLVLIEICKNLPYAGGAVCFFLLPAAALGVMGRAALNALVYKKFYTPPWDNPAQGRPSAAVQAILTEENP
jgi:hypothetical protein